MTKLYHYSADKVNRKSVTIPKRLHKISIVYIM